MTLNDDVKIILTMTLIFVGMFFLFGALNSASEMQDCEGFQAVYGEIITCEKQLLWTRGYVELPDGGQFELDYTINDHVIIQAIY